MISSHDSAVFCISCGTKLPAEAAFCWKCGVPVGGSKVVEAEKQEYCEIHRSAWSARIWGWERYDCCFEAQAIGPTGQYIARKSPIYRADDNGAGRDSYHGGVLDDFVKALIDDGWHPTGERGESPWSMKFRRVAQ